ncbi:MAG: hypothetical protein EPN26_10885 [Rhodospirillales bacterium]|nr:MAG: hypothetical protein EPN26_10885 [Rhodospirillales bacterium]
MGLGGLRALYFDGTLVSDLSPLAWLSGLQHLYFDGTLVSDLSPLARLSGLQTLFFRNTLVSDLSPLAGLANLEDLDFSGCPNIADPVLIELSKKDNPERTIETLRYLRGQVPPLPMPPQMSPSIPAQSKAPLQVAFEDGILKALPPHSPELDSADATKRAKEAYDALKEMAAEIQGNMAGGNYPHVSQAVAAYCRALGNNFHEFRQVPLGMHGERIKAQAATAHEFMSDALAADMKGLAAAHAIFLQRFADWQEFLDDIKGHRLDPAAAQAARPAALGVIGVLEKQDNVDKEVTQSLVEQEGDLDDGGTNDPVRNQGFYRSLNNVLISLAGRAMMEASRFSRDVKDQLRPEAVKMTARAIVWTGPIAALWETLSGFPHLSQLAAHNPDAVPWLQAFIDWWKHRPRQ